MGIFNKMELALNEILEYTPVKNEIIEWLLDFRDTSKEEIHSVFERFILNFTIKNNRVPSLEDFKKSVEEEYGVEDGSDFGQKLGSWISNY